MKKLFSPTNLRFLLLSVLLTLHSCKEKEVEVDKCTNGFKDSGETNIDCGGSCPACPEQKLTYLHAKINGVDVSFGNKSLEKINANYILSFSNDSINIVLNLGTHEAVGNYPIVPAGTTCQYKQVNYNTATDGTHAISKNETSKRIRSGFFSVDFGNSITVSVTVRDGAYNDMSY